MSESMDVKNTSKEECEELRQKFDLFLNKYGLECYPFQIGSYNDKVSKHFVLPYSNDTLGFIILSQPSMFEKSFIPYIIKQEDPTGGIQDPLDSCMAEVFGKFKDYFNDIQMESIQDFELTPSRRPKIIVQTAGHISGAVRLYQRKDVKNDPWDEDTNIYGLCLHPKFGGWFAFRGVVILPQYQCSSLMINTCKDILDSEDKIIDLLNRYNNNWKDWSYRDVIPVEERYSDIQKEYFYQPPNERSGVIEKIIKLNQV